MSSPRRTSNQGKGRLATSSGSVPMRISVRSLNPSSSLSLSSSQASALPIPVGVALQGVLGPDAVVRDIDDPVAIGVAVGLASPRRRLVSCDGSHSAPDRRSHGTAQTVARMVPQT
jgi:hypothetical protein